MSAPQDLHGRIDPALHRRLHAWVDHSLITEQEADAIEAYEESLPSARPRRVPLATEALAYMGIALGAAAAAVLLGREWEDLSTTVRIVCVGAGALVLFLAGLPLARSKEPVYARLGSVLWLASTGLVAWFTWLVAYDGFDARGNVPACVAGAAMALVAGAMFAVTRRELQQIGLLIGLVMFGAAIFADPIPSSTVAWAIGVLWVALAAVGKLTPDWSAYATGALVALYTPAVIQGNDSDLGMWLGLVTGVALVAASVGLHEGILLALGAVGMFAYLVMVIANLFHGSAGVPIALFVAGAVTLGVALVLARRASGRPPRTT
jgi:hypothetical protein